MASNMKGDCSFILCWYFIYLLSQYAPSEVDKRRLAHFSVIYSAVNIIFPPFSLFMWVTCFVLHRDQFVYVWLFPTLTQSNSAFSANVYNAPLWRISHPTSCLTFLLNWGWSHYRKTQLLRFPSNNVQTLRYVASEVSRQQAFSLKL